MPVLLLGPGDYRTMPWANGRGSTVEYAAEMRDGALLWRVSKASVTEDGPFSHLPGIDRTIMLVSGAGFRLDFDGEVSRDVRERFHPVSFSGDWRTSASGVAGPCEDLNVMVRRDAATAAVTIHRSGGRTTLAGRSVFLVFEGDWSLGLSGKGYAVGAGQSLLVTDEDGGNVNLEGTGLLIEVAVRFHA